MSAIAVTPPGETTRRPIVLSKVPEATAFFWGLKILSTGMGECLSDTLRNSIGIAAEIGGVLGLVLALTWQFRQDRFRTWPYWTAVAMVAVVGTMLADVLHKDGGLPWPTVTAIYAVVLAGCIGLWWRTEGTLSIHSITNRRREAFYWATVMATFALGTAVGDLCATNLRTGFLDAGLFFTGIILLPFLAWRFLGLNGVVAFWSSYVITRPLGASFADYAWVPTAAGGLDLGKDTVSLITLPIFLALVAVAARTRDGQPATRHEVARALA